MEVIKFDKPFPLPEYRSFPVDFNGTTFVYNISKDCCSWVFTTEQTSKLLNLLKKGLTPEEIILKITRGNLSEESKRKKYNMMKIFLIYLFKSCFNKNYTPKIKKIPVSELDVHFKATNQCNFNCPYCIEDSGKKTSELEYNQIKNVFTKLIGFYSNSCNFYPKNKQSIIKYSEKPPSVTLSGGEFLMRKDSTRIIDFLDNLGFRVNLFTNGYEISKLNKHILKKLKQIQISIDGPKEFHELVRKKGSYVKILKNLKKLSEHHGDISIAVLFSDYHEERIRKKGFEKSKDEYIDFLKKIIEISPGSKLNITLQDKGGRSDIKLKKGCLSAKLRDILVKQFNSHIVNETKIFTKGYYLYNCSIGLSPTITENGDIYPCTKDHYRFLPVNNILSDPIKTTYEKLIKIYNNTGLPVVNGECESCYFAGIFCHGKCRLDLVDKQYQLKKQRKDCISCNLSPDLNDVKLLLKKELNQDFFKHFY
ncbi:radical SAM protein [Candidatus Woesearchaeota archaeon]|nr:radical SAM protein [Candidatus Woesearchaeota archaeon]